MTITSPVTIVEKVPNLYRFHIIPENGSMSTSTIYFERNNPGSGPIKNRFLGSLEFIFSSNLRSCFDLIYSSEKRKIDAFAGFIEEPEDEFPFEFSTVFTCEDVEYSNYHLVGELYGSRILHVTLLGGFTDEDIQNIRSFQQNIELNGTVKGLVEGEILEIKFNSESIRDSVGQVLYLN
jgi:hypothetical protein